VAEKDRDEALIELLWTFPVRGVRRTVLWHPFLVRTAVDVFQTDDVVLGQVISRLDLDDLQRLGPGVGQAMRAPNRHVGGLIHSQSKDFVSTCHLGYTPDNDPVLCPVLVQLKAETGPWIDHDVLDLESLTAVDRLEAAPRAMDLAVTCRKLGVHFLDTCH
jgi:hypothetical protein